MEHLALEIFDRNGENGQFANLPKKSSITVIVESPLFGSGNIWSFPFTLNILANLHIFKSAGELHGSRLHDIIDGLRARLWVEGIGLYYGYIQLDSEVTVSDDGDVDVVFSSGHKTFDERIEGGKANQVPLLGDVLLGMALWRPRKTQVVVEMEISPTTSGSTVVKGNYAFGGADVEGSVSEGKKVVLGSINGAQLYPKYMIPYGIFNDDVGITIEKSETINTDKAYYEDEHGAVQNPYCNIAICYQKKGYEHTNADGTKETDYSQDPVAVRGFDVSPADRVNTAPCFYVMYWLRALFTHLSIVVDENQLMAVEDMRRLFFVNTKCAYEVPDELNANDERYDWCGFFRTSLPGEYPSNYNYESKVTAKVPLFVEERIKETFLNAEESQINATAVLEGELTDSNGNPVQQSFIDTYGDPKELITGYAISIKALCRPYDWFSHQIGMSPAIYYPQGGGEFLTGICGVFGHKAYATSDNFPDVDITEVIKALEDGFGVRFVFDETYQRVRIVLIRNILRSNRVQEVSCKVLGKAELTETNVRGFRMTYGASDDTAYCYKPFQDALPSGDKTKEWNDDSDTHDYSQMKTDSSYAEAKQNVTAFNKTCYIDPSDGNAYGVKVDKDAKRYNEQFPSLFEFAGYMDAEDGDCSSEDEDSVKELSLSFAPAIMNDVNGNDKSSTKQSFALFVDEEMEPRRYQLADRDCNRPDVLYPITELFNECFTNTVEPWNEKNRYALEDRGDGKPGAFSIFSDMYVRRRNLTATLPLVHYYAGSDTILKMSLDIDIEGYINEGYKLYLQDNFEPNDDGVSPIETHDWGLTLGIMRGSGSDAQVVCEPDNIEDEGNETWEIEAGSSATAHPDSCDDYGRQWDYNGDQSGVGDTDGRFSLKLRAEKPNPDFDKSHPESATNKRYLDITDPLNQRRGLMDQFHSEESYWWRNARVAKQPVRMEIATLKGIDLMTRARIGDITGFVKRMTIPIDIDTGLGQVEVEQMYL